MFKSLNKAQDYLTNLNEVLSAQKRVNDMLVSALFDDRDIRHIKHLGNETEHQLRLEAQKVLNWIDGQKSGLE